MLFPLLTVQKTFVSTPFGYLSRRLLHKTYYEVLGLTRNCTIKDIKSAYITLSKKFHPDNNTKDASHKEFLKISEAYNVLSKPDKRRLYDWELERQVYQKSFNSRPRPRPPPRSPRSPFEDEFIWRRYQSHNDHDNYYGVPGVKRLSNGVVAWFCVFFTVICATIQFYAIRQYDNVKK
ncbi:dnaJ-like protein 60 isoform X2 [Photinus pyralis]|uniref:J domain-containing protein n=1 Tax=Photinus pyralis TaxID=7054 RepID=A0A1Y1LQB6_PHOPY|nr:dnaJ-like protein 60 isoform X2 [Photinus pyralis]